MHCPSCNSRLVGKIGSRQYYCWSCCVEFAQRADRWEIYEVDQDGMLVPSEPAGLPKCRECSA